MVKCIDPTLHLTSYSYCPSLPISILFSTLYILTTLLHIYQSLTTHTLLLLWPLITGSTWLTASYILRCFSILHPTSAGLFDPQFVLILISPLWINAFDYLILGRLIEKYIPEKRILGLKGRRCTAVFVGLDIFSFLIQIIGAITTINHNPTIWHIGIRIYTAGVSFQFLVICGFLVLVISFRKRMEILSLTGKGKGNGKEEDKSLIFPLGFSLGLIMLRILFRVIEFSSGRGTKLSTEIAVHEWYGYVFDAVPMFFALVGWNLIHPGRVLGGKRVRDGDGGNGVGIEGMGGKSSSPEERVIEVV